MLLSTGTTYALRATLYMVRQPDDGFLSIRSISDGLGISFHFLTKLFQLLTEAGIIKSYRGPNGGVRFARAPASISLFDIVNAVEGPEVFKECVLALPRCGDAHPCPLHTDWKIQREALHNLFAGTSLQALEDDPHLTILRLSDPED